MAESYIQMPADGVGKKVRTNKQTVGADEVHSDVIVVSKPDGTVINPATEDGKLADIKTNTDKIISAPATESKQDDIISEVKPLSVPVTTSLTLTTADTSYKMPPTELTNRRLLVIYNASDTAVYIGSSSVTTSNGIIIESGGVMTIDSEKDLYAVCGVGGKTINLLELA